MNCEPRPAIYMEKQLGWGRASVNLHGGSRSVSQVDGVSAMAPAYRLCGGKAQQRDNGLPSP